MRLFSLAYRRIVQMRQIFLQCLALKPEPRIFVKVLRSNTFTKILVIRLDCEARQLIRSSYETTLARANS